MTQEIGKAGRTGATAAGLARVAWHDQEGNSYWVSNTLLRTLDEDQMLTIAKSLEEAHG